MVSCPWVGLVVVTVAALDPSPDEATLLQMGKVSSHAKQTSFPPCNPTDFQNSEGEDCSVYADGGKKCHDDSQAWQMCPGCGGCTDFAARDAPCVPGTQRPIWRNWHERDNPCMYELCSGNKQWHFTEVECPSHAEKGGDCLPWAFTPPAEGECCGSCSVTHQKYMTHRLPTAPTMCKAIDNPEACKQAATELGIEFLVSQEAPGGCIVNSRKSPNQVSFNTVTPTEIDEDPLDAETFPPCSDGPHGSGPFGTDWFKNSVGQDCSAYADGENCSDDSGAWQHCSGCGHCGDPEPVAVTPTEWTHRLCVRPAAEAATTTTTPPPTTTTTVPCSDSVLLDSKYVPDMPGGGRTEVATVELCRERCADLSGCVHYSFWPKDDGCHLGNITASLEDDKWGGKAGRLCN